MMKREAEKSGKRRQAAVPATKAACGTLMYIAECRGAVLKSATARWTAPPDGENKMIRK